MKRKAEMPLAVMLDKRAKTIEDNLIIVGTVLVKVKNSELLEEEFKCPEGITEIADRAFYACRKVKKIHLPDTITRIGQLAFYYCDELHHINFPKSLKVIEEYAFDQCHKLTAIDLSDQVNFIGNYAFSACYNLSRISLYRNIDCHPNAFPMIDCCLPTYVILMNGDEADLKRIYELLALSPNSIKDRLISKNYYTNWKLNAEEALTSNGLVKDAARLIFSKSLELSFFKKALDKSADSKKENQDLPRTQI